MYVKYIDTIKTKGGERNKEPLGGRNPVSWSISSSGALGSGRTWPSASQISSFLPTQQKYIEELEQLFKMTRS